ncbi:MAG: hypothetical protein JO154_07100 [Chitinophaga sp.]|uniref:ImmA/IrrE family metallo-endopeptidase n=1 Tax=Chitinophaga sp. TaxID=1869181 RepID=UPI0025B806FF|nr:hypothetical protein [Chitinophaga sp.]MBV8252359.1 hypothetical protein [Chitinophaga sp.]
MKNVFSIIHIVLLTICASPSRAQSNGCTSTLAINNQGGLPSQHYIMSNFSGNNQLDMFLNREVNVLRNFFGVNPGVFYFQDDPAAPNALAMPVIESYNNPSGTIILGLNLASREFGISWSGTTIPLILAHEFGHILDYNMQALPNYDTKTKELFADFMAGCFLFYRSTLTYTDINAIVVSFYSKGEYDFNNPNHHGTPDERRNALTAGYNWLKSVSSPSVYVSPKDAIVAAKAYLNSN